MPKEDYHTGVPTEYLQSIVTPISSSHRVALKMNNPSRHLRQVTVVGCVSHNPNTFAGLVGKVRKKLSGRRKEGRVEKKSARNPGLEPGTCRVLGEGPQLHARGAV